MMRVVFCAATGWLFYIYAGYPLTLWIIARRSYIRLRSSEDYMPSVSVLMAARNEERDIAWKIAETLAWDYPRDKLQLLVGSDASDDRTDEIVSEIKDPRLSLIRIEQRGGKARALNRLTESASGQIFFFTDVNAHIGKRALRLMVKHFADKRVGCVTGSSVSMDGGEAQPVAATAGLYRKYESMLRNLESTLGSVLNCDGAIFCMRSALFQRLSPELANDLETPMRLGAAGWKIIHEPDALVVERDTSSPLEEFTRQRRMCAQGMAAMFLLPGVFGGLRGWQFWSHKFLRWLSLIPMIAALVSSAALAGESALYASALMLQAIFYGMAAAGLAALIVGRDVPRIVSVPFYVMLGLTAALVGVFDAIVGRRFDVWESPASSRSDANSPVVRSKAQPVAPSAAGDRNGQGSGNLAPARHTLDAAAVRESN